VAAAARAAPAEIDRLAARHRTFASPAGHRQAKLLQPKPFVTPRSSGRGGGLVDFRHLDSDFRPDQEGAGRPGPQGHPRP
jgi:hypothetical protein